MKQKILNALKTAYANLGLSERALDGVASFLEKTITDENGIDAAIKEASVAELLKTYQSEMDSERGKASKAVKDLEDYKKAHPEGTPPTKKTEGEEESETAKLLRELMADFDKQKAELAAERKRNTDTALLESVRAELKSKHGCSSDYILKKILAGAEVKDGDTVESLTAQFKKAYDAEYKEAYGNGAQAPAGNFFQNLPDDDKDEFAGAIARLRSSGVLPKDKKE